jgi:hypothetical protein
MPSPTHQPDDAMSAAVESLLAKRGAMAGDRMSARPMKSFDFARLDAMIESEAAAGGVAPGDGWRGAVVETWRVWSATLRSRMMIGATAGTLAVALLLVATAIWSFRPVGEWRPLGQAGRAPGGVAIAEAMRGGDELDASLNGPGLLRLAAADVFVSARAAVTVEDARRVRLDEGELWFEVEKGAVPFVVETPAGRITVAGTSFGLRMEGDRLAVSLLEGELQLVTPTLARTIRPGEAVLVSRGSSELRFDLAGVSEPRWLRPVRPLASPAV